MILKIKRIADDWKSQWWIRDDVVEFEFVDTLRMMQGDKGASEEFFMTLNDDETMKCFLSSDVYEEGTDYREHPIRHMKINYRCKNSDKWMGVVFDRVAYILNNDGVIIESMVIEK